MSLVPLDLYLQPLELDFHDPHTWHTLVNVRATGSHNNCCATSEATRDKITSTTLQSLYRFSATVPFHLSSLLDDILAVSVQAFEDAFPT